MLRSGVMSSDFAQGLGIEFFGPILLTIRLWRASRNKAEQIDIGSLLDPSFSIERARERGPFPVTIRISSLHNYCWAGSWAFEWGIELRTLMVRTDSNLIPLVFNVAAEGFSFSWRDISAVRTAVIRPSVWLQAECGQSRIYGLEMGASALDVLIPGLNQIQTHVPFITLRAIILRKARCRDGLGPHEETLETVIRL